MKDNKYFEELDKSFEREIGRAERARERLRQWRERELTKDPGYFEFMEKQAAKENTEND